MATRGSKNDRADLGVDRCRGDQFSVALGHVVAPILVVLAGMAAYASSFDGIFLFDDTGHILTTQRIRNLWPPWELMAGRRPIVDLTLAINFAIGELRPWGYHALNLIVHVVASLTLYGVVRRTANRLTDAALARRLALASAMLFAVHPLQTQSVTYIIQRGESMMGMFYLLTLYCVIRGVESGDDASTSLRGVTWFVVAAIACAFGMGSKAVMVTAPVAVLLYDRTFLAGSFAGALRDRLWLYLALAATWSVLGVCGVVSGVLNPSHASATVGFSYKGITPVEYALTQFGVIVRYLRLSVWPFPLCLDYQWAVASGFVSIVLPGLIVVVLVLGCFFLLRSRSWLGFVVAWMLLVLLPTSSIIPIKDTLFEHRMYLSLAAVLVTGCACGYAFISRALGAVGFGTSFCSRATDVLVGALVIAGIVSTYKRNAVYASGVAMWSDVVAKRPANARAFSNLGNAFLDLGENDEAVEQFRVALRLRPGLAEAHNNLGKGLSALGKKSEAIDAYRNAIAAQPGFAQAHNNLGNLLNELREHERALEHLNEAISVSPKYANAYNNRGLVYAHGLSDFPRAIRDFDQAIALNPLYAGSFYSRGLCYFEMGDFDRAMQDYERAISIDPTLPEAYFARGMVWKERGDPDKAVGEFDRAIALRPTYSLAWFNRGLACDSAKRIEEAIRSYRRYIQLAPQGDSAWIQRTKRRIAHLQGGESG